MLESVITTDVTRNSCNDGEYLAASLVRVRLASRPETYFYYMACLLFSSFFSYLLSFIVYLFRNSSILMDHLL